MAGVKELKIKIKSTKGTLKITSAMKLVSAAKMSKAQYAVMNARPYSRELEDIIRTASALSSDFNHPYLTKKSDDNPASKKAVLIIISSNKGLCGGYNTQLAKEVKKFLSETNLDVKVHYIGKKVRDLTIKSTTNPGKTFEFKKNEPTLEELKLIANEMAHAFTNDEIGSVFVAYNVFQSALVFIPTVKQILPITMNEAELEKLKGTSDYVYEPSAEKILNAMIPVAYVNTLYTCLLDALASEHGARMTAMDSAAKNSKSAIKKLSIYMNKLRQAAITTELAEVVSGAESLNG